MNGGGIGHEKKAGVFSLCCYICSYLTKGGGSIGLNNRILVYISCMFNNQINLKEEREDV